MGLSGEQWGEERPNWRRWRSDAFIFLPAYLYFRRLFFFLFRLLFFISLMRPLLYVERGRVSGEIPSLVFVYRRPARRAAIDSRCESVPRLYGHARCSWPASPARGWRWNPARAAPGWAPSTLCFVFALLHFLFSLPLPSLSALPSSENRTPQVAALSLTSFRSGGLLIVGVLSASAWRAVSL